VSSGRLIDDTRTHKVTTLELFFDLVFVYGISQVTAFLAADHSPVGFVKGLLLLALLWWAWAAYSWLGTSLHIDDGSVRLAIFAAMGAIMIVALAMPYWYDPQTGLSAALLATAAYVAVRIMHVVLYYLGGRGDDDLQRAVTRLAASVGISAVLLIGGAYLGGTTQLILVGVAVLIDFGGPLIGRGAGWRLALGHFAERHGLIVIIALGESIVAIGVGAAGLQMSAGLLLMVLLGIALACVLWLNYFTANADDVEQTLHRRTGAEQVTGARDVYSYLHLLLVAGLVLMALAVKSSLGYVDSFGLGAKLAGYAAGSLGAGLALFLFGLWAMRRRVGLPTGPWLTAGPLLALVVIPLALAAAAPAALGAGVAVAYLALLGSKSVE
jgi:low temperature requirement protein LtrA